MMNTPEKEPRMWGEDGMDWASSMAACAAERALTRDWEKHPMFGIGVDKDKWAIGYQSAEAKLKEILIKEAE